MPLGPGKYDDITTLVRKRTKAKGGVIVIVLGGKYGDGFSCQADWKTTLALPPMLEDIARQIRKSGPLGEPEEDEPSKPDAFDSPEWKAYADNFIREALPQLKQSFATVSLLPSKGFDVKFALELGAAIMLDKPIMLVAPPGRKISDHMMRVVDKVIIGDLMTDEGKAKVNDAIKAYLNQ